MYPYNGHSSGEYHSQHGHSSGEYHSQHHHHESSLADANAYHSYPHPHHHHYHPEQHTDSYHGRPQYSDSPENHPSFYPPGPPPQMLHQYPPDPFARFPPPAYPPSVYPPPPPQASQPPFYPPPAAAPSMLGQYPPPPAQYPPPPPQSYHYPPSEPADPRPYTRPHTQLHVPQAQGHAPNVPAIIATEAAPKPSLPLAAPHGSSHHHAAADVHLPSQVELPKGQLVRVFCKAGRSFNLAAQDGRLVMAPANSEDDSQQWLRDDKFGFRVRDSYGHPAFMLINKACKKVLKPAKEDSQQVVLVNYNPSVEDDGLLWTESQDFGEGFKTLRMASDTLLNMTVLHGERGVKEGSSVVLDTWHKKDNQLWKLFPL